MNRGLKEEPIAIFIRIVNNCFVDSQNRPIGEDLLKEVAIFIIPVSSFWPSHCKLHCGCHNPRPRRHFHEVKFWCFPSRHQILRGFPQVFWRPKQRDRFLLWGAKMWISTLQSSPQLLDDEERRGSSSSPPKMPERPTWGGAGNPPILGKGKEFAPGNPAKTSPKEVGFTTITTGLVSALPSPESKGGISSTSELSANSAS